MTAKIECEISLSNRRVWIFFKNHLKGNSSVSTRAVNQSSQLPYVPNWLSTETIDSSIILVDSSCQVMLTTKFSINRHFV